MAERIGRVGTRRKSAFEMLPDDESRIRFVGAELKVHGRQWADAHPEEMGWLDCQGVTEQQAIRSHEVWHVEEMKNPFWTPARKRPDGK